MGRYISQPFPPSTIPISLLLAKVLCQSIFRCGFCSSLHFHLLYQRLICLQRPLLSSSTVCNRTAQPVKEFKKIASPLSKAASQIILPLSATIISNLLLRVNTRSIEISARDDTKVWIQNLKFLEGRRLIERKKCRETTLLSRIIGYAGDTVWQTGVSGKS